MDITTALHLWSLAAPTLIAETPTSLVYRVTRPDHSPAVLKLLKPDIGDEEATGGALMHWFDGNGAATIYGHTDGAVLMQWLDGGSLGDLARSGHDANATDILCDVVERLHTPRYTSPPTLIPLRQRFASLFHTRASGWPHQARDLVARATGIAYALFDRPLPTIPLHGDIHHDNILRVGSDWRAIDPKGLLGDPAYDYANSFQNPERGDAFVLDATRVAGHATAIAERSGIARKHLLAWAVAHTALSGAWHIEDGSPAPHQVTMLSLLLPAWDAA